jgi:hypothetical protein
MNQTAKKTRVYAEDVKTQHTTHWDWDYMTQAQIDQMISSNRSKRRFKLPALFRRQRKRQRRITLLAAALLCVLAMAAVAIHAFI